MVTKEAMKSPLKNVAISRVVILSGLLTFMYCIEFAIGIRTVYHTIKIWNDPSTGTRQVNWILCVGCFFVAVVSSFSVNVLSAIWEQKQLEEREKHKSPIRFTFHIIVGGMIWRYISLWCVESKKYQKKCALLLTMIKFFFTQTFTIPMAIVHVSVLEHYDELIYDISIVLCVSINLILTCTMFAWCPKEVEELKKWDFETVDLVPLIFQSDPQATTGQVSEIADNSISKEISKPEKKKDIDNGMECEDMIIKTIVLLQSFGFSFGRLLALGILLKLAGIYAVSIMFLQLLISVIYLKFQAPILVSDSLPKWRQLSRLAFMSYILIFEWHINRDPKTAYDFSSNMKHSIFYYCIATVESVFYLVTWAITTSYTSKSESNDIANQQNQFCRVILVIGSLALVFSLTIHIVLLFWHSRRISSFMNSVRRRYESTKLRLSKYGCGKEKEQKPEKRSQRSHIDISSPILIRKSDSGNGGCELERHASYRDLREPLDDEIEIYFRKCENKSKETSSDRRSDDVRQITIPDEPNETSKTSNVIKAIDHLLHNEVSSFHSKSSENFEDSENPKTAPTVETNLSMEEETSPDNRSDDVRHITMPDESNKVSKTYNVVKAIDHLLHNEVNNFHSKSSDNFEDSENPKTAATVETNVSMEEKNAEEVEEQSTENNSKCKKKSFSVSISEKWGKVSRKVTGAMKEQFQKRKEQVQNFRGTSDSKSSETAESSPEMPEPDATSNSSFQTANEEDETEGYFVGDSRCHQEEESLQSVLSRCHQEESLQSVHSIGEKRIRFLDEMRLPDCPEEADDETIPSSDVNHKEGDSPCPCYICRTLGDGRFRRRRSSSVPPADRKAKQEEDMSTNQTLSRYMSNPNISQNLCEKIRYELRPRDNRISSSGALKKQSFNLSALSLENRIEHYV